MNTRSRSLRPLAMVFCVTGQGKRLASSTQSPTNVGRDVERVRPHLLPTLDAGRALPTSLVEMVEPCDRGDAAQTLAV